MPLYSSLVFLKYGRLNTLGSTNKVKQNMDLKTIIISLGSDQAKKKNISKMGANSKQAIKRRVMSTRI